MLVYSNIFQPRNDWGVITLRCKSLRYRTAFYVQVAKIIKEVWGTDPLTLKVYQGADEVISRQLFAVMMRKYTKDTLATVGGYLGKVHSTVYFSAKSVQDMYDTNKTFRVKYDKIDKKVFELTNK